MELAYKNASRPHELMCVVGLWIENHKSSIIHLVLDKVEWKSNQIQGTEIRGNLFFMGKLITSSKPLILQSKFLCFSLLYLFTSLFLALYTISFQSKCLFISSSFHPIQTSFFSYPSSYGEHKYAVSTTRSTCSSPVNFSGTGKKQSFLWYQHKNVVEFFCL